MNWEKSDTDSDSENETVFTTGLMISKDDAEKNYELAGTLVDEPPDEISISMHEHLLNDPIHVLILEVMHETKIGYRLSDFQMLSLHVLGSQKNLILISPTGSGKMLGRLVYLSADLK
jgi:hypothetical protein